MKPYTASEFSDLTGSYFEELVGKRMGSTLLRHSFITLALCDKNMTDGEKALLAYQMSHSITIQSTYRVIDKEGQGDVLNFTGTVDKEEQEGFNKKVKELALLLGKQQTIRRRRRSVGKIENIKTHLDIEGR